MIYRRDGLVFMTFDTDGWGELKIARIHPKGDNWGAFKDIEGWGSLIPEVRESDLDMALRGYARPLLDNGLRSPEACLKLVEVPKPCLNISSCVSADKSKCLLGSRALPDCFELSSGGSGGVIISAWLEGYTVVRAR